MRVENKEEEVALVQDTDLDNSQKEGKELQLSIEPSDVEAHGDNHLFKTEGLQGLDVIDDPKAWPESRKWLHVMIVASIALATPLASAIFTPALDQVVEEFQTVDSLAHLAVSSYVLGFAAGPHVIAPLSEVYGRLYVYHVCNILLFLGNIGCATAPSIGWLIVFRFLTGCAGASPMTQGSGTIADLMEKEKRGRAISLIAFGSVCGPVIGPVLGGQIAECLGWRGCFWALNLVVGFNIIFALLYMRETSADAIRRRAVRWKTRDAGHSYTEALSTLRIAALRPFRLALHPVVLSIAMLSSFFYSLQVWLYIDIPETYKSQYDFSTGEAGVSFLGMGVGMMLGLLTFGMFSDRIMTFLAHGGTKRPEHRLPLMIVSAVLASCGLVVYAVSSTWRAPWIFAVLGNGCTGVGLFSMAMSASVFLIDLSPQNAVSTAATLSIIRFTTGSIIPVLLEQFAIVSGRGAIKIALATLILLWIPFIHMLYRRGQELLRAYPIDAPTRA